MTDPQPWQLRNRRLAWGNQWYRVLHDEVELPDGSVIDYYLSERPHVAIVFAVTDDDQVVLVRQYRHGSGQIMLELPGGTFVDGESPIGAAERELREETGYWCENLTAAGTFFDDASRNTNAVHVFFGRGARVVGPPVLDAVEAASGLETLLVRSADVPGLIESGAVNGQISVAAMYSAMRLL